MSNLIIFFLTLQDMFSPPKIHPALSLRRSMDMYDSRESHDRRHLFHTAMRIKKRAITQRLGARARLGGYPEVPRYQTRGRYRWRGRGLGRPRWATSYTPGRYGGGFRQGNLNFFWKLKLKSLGKSSFPWINHYLLACSVEASVSTSWDQSFCPNFHQFPLQITFLTLKDILQSFDEASMTAFSIPCVNGPLNFRY